MHKIEAEGMEPEKLAIIEYEAQEKVAQRQRERTFLKQFGFLENFTLLALFFVPSRMKRTD